MYFDSTSAHWLTPNVNIDDEAKYRAEYYAAKDAGKHAKPAMKETSPVTQEPIIRAGILARFGRFMPLI